MKILITNTGPWGTGSFTVAYAILQEMLALGHDVMLFFPDSGMSSKDRETFYGSPHLAIWHFPIKNDSIQLDSFPLMIPDPHPRSTDEKTFKELSDEEWQLYFASLKENLTQVIHDFHPDIVECQHIWTMENIIHDLGLPYICTAHHSDQMGFLYDTRMQPTAIQGAKNAQHIFAISEYVKDEVVSLYGVEEDKVSILTNGYNRDIFQPKQLDRKAILAEFCLSIPEDATLITFAGKLSKTKGIDTLLLANKLLNRKDVHFLILGAGILDKVLDEKLLDQYEMERMHFLGHQMQSALAKLHNISKFSVIPSRTEGFGITCLEAMGCAIPVIATDVGGLKDIAIGKIIPPDNPGVLANTILEMVDMGCMEYENLRYKALDKAREYSWKVIAQKRIAQYYHTLKQKL